ALGAILYFLLMGHSPVASAPGELAAQPAIAPRKWKPSIPRPLKAICLKAMSADCAARYPSVENLSKDIARFLAQLRVEAYQEGVIDTVRRLGSKYRTAILLIVAYLVVRIVLLLWIGT